MLKLDNSFFVYIEKLPALPLFKIFSQISTLKFNFGSKKRAIFVLNRK
jgi:hypothetical protein